MVKVIQSPIKKFNWTSATGVWTNSFMVSVIFLFLLFMAPFAAMGANLAQTNNEGNRTMVAISMTLYAAAVTVFMSSFLTYWSRVTLSGILMILAIAFALTHRADNENAKASSYATVAMIAAVLLFLTVFGPGKDSSSLLLADSIAGNYIYKIDQLVNDVNYTNARTNNPPLIDDKQHKKIMNRRSDLMSYLWSGSRDDYREPGTVNNKNFKTLLDDIDKKVLGDPSNKKPDAELTNLITVMNSGNRKHYVDLHSADRLKFMPGDGKKDKGKKGGAPAGGAPAGGAPAGGAPAGGGAPAAPVKTGGCFPIGSLVTTPSGPVAIQDLREGDDVYGYVDNALTRSKVSRVFEHKGMFDTLQIDHTSGSLIVTGNHSILTNSKYVQAETLKVGDTIFTGQGEPVQITNISPSDDREVVYNIDVENIHNYVVDDIQVHSYDAYKWYN